MIDIIKAVFFGVIEGITEWLPVSSTGHMILLDEFIKLDVTKEFREMFLVVIQFGAILAVVVTYWKTVWPVRKAKHGKSIYVISKKTISLWGKTIIACLPAAVIGLIFDDMINDYFYNWKVVSIMLIAVGVAFIVIEKKNGTGSPYRRTYVDPIDCLDNISYSKAFKIGLFQVVAAILPGTSRSGATIIGGLLLGVSRKAAAEFTFILAIPVMAGASLLKIVKYFANGFALSCMETIILAIGMLVAFVVSMAIIKFLMGYIRKHDFKIFGWYRIALGILVVVYFMIAG